MKKLIFAFLLASVITGCSSDGLLDEGASSANTAILENFDSQTDFKKEARVLGDNLDHSFESSMTKSGEILYPDYYGGSYINEKGKLVVLVVGDTAQYRSNILSRTRSNNFELIQCDYSYNKLLNVINNLNSYFETQEGIKVFHDLSINAFGLLDNKNRIFVNIRNLTSEKINKFKTHISDTTALLFQDGDYEGKAQTSELHPGDPLYTALNGINGGTIGYRVKSGSVVGFVTCGHVVKRITAPVYYSDNMGRVQIGSCVKFINNGDMDAAFCQLTNTAYTISNQTAFGSQLSTSLRTLKVGDDVCMDGRSTNHRTYGVVEATNISVSFKDNETGGYTPLYKGLTQTDYECNDGDSGGVVYSYDYKTVGMHEGGAYSLLANKYIGYYWPASTVNSKLGVARY